MHVGDGPDQPQRNVGPNGVCQLICFFLDFTITNSGDLTPEINRRRDLAIKVMQFLWKPLLYVTENKTRHCVGTVNSLRSRNAAPHEDPGKEDRQL